MKSLRIISLIIGWLLAVNRSDAANRFWVSVLGGNWTSTLNWSVSSGGLPGASAPGSSDIAIFDGGALGLSVGNCTMNTTINISGITVTSAYTGTISQGANTITISGAAGFGGGTFAGGSAAITITGSMTISATAFTSTSATMELRGDAAFTGGSFTHNNGWVRFNDAAAQNITGTSPVFYDLEFVGRGNSYTISSAGTIGVANSLNISGTASCVLNTGAMNISGNINLTNTSTGDGGTATINITGAASQSITSTLLINQGSLPNININKTGGILTLPVLLTVVGNWTYTAGTIDAATNNATVVFNSTLTITGTHTLSNIIFEGSNNWTFTLAAGTILTATGNMSLTGTNNIILNTGDISLKGDLLLTNTSTGDGGTATINFTGTTNQAINSALLINQSTLPSINISKSSGTLTLPVLITVKGNWTYTTGLLDPTTNNSTVVFAGTLTFTGSHSLNNVSFEGNNNWTFSFNSGTVLTVAGAFTTTGSSNIFINDATAGATAIQAQGDITINNTSATGGGNALILINGTGTQTFTGNAAAGQGLMPFITIQKPSGALNLNGIISVSRSWTWSSGSVSPNTSTINFGGNNLSVTSAGMSFYNVTVRANTITLVNNLTVNNNLNINSPAILVPGANTINLGGNWSDWGSGGFTESTSTVNFNGTSQQSMTATGGENFTNITINNSAGLQLVNSMAVASTFNMNQGNFDLNTNTLTLGTSAILPGTLNYTAGKMINSGSFTRWFAKSTIASGNAAGLFPMGTTTDYRPFSVSVPTAPTTGGTITVAYSDAPYNSVVSIADAPFTVVVRKDLNWAVSTNTLAGGVYNLGISGTNYGLVGMVSDLRLTLANAVTGSPGTNAGTTLNPQVNRTGLTQTSLNNTFYLGSVDVVSSPLPITLVSFTAALIDNNQVVLNWTTSPEMINNDFTVQRTTDTSNWESIGQVTKADNITTLVYYRSYDRSPDAGISYYRLMQTDADGNKNYSAIKQVNIGVGAVVSVYPNPASNYVTVRLPGQYRYELSVFNNNGQAVTTAITDSGGSSIINTSLLPPGIYFIRISHMNYAETKTFIIRR